MIRLIASDIDGTLLQNGAAAIPPEIFAEIGRLGRKGIRFCPASGRQYSSLRRLFAPAADLLPFLCDNGSVVYGPGDPGPVLGKTPMPREKALALCRDILAVPGLEALISGADTSYLCPKDPRYVAVVEAVGNRIVLLPRPEDVPEEIIKISAWCPRGTAEGERALLPRWGKVFRAAVAGAQWLDFTLADKGTGLACLCAALGIAPEEVMAFGDNWNDAPMLERAGQPWLVEGADPALKARFPRCCRSVAEVLRTL